ncbi:MAG: hypothetical protein M1824_002358 [Vezdaea acicularis]|nr:MAG: hypothetical protein M1824_002358 [Vezdaea acicularis]
MLLTKPVLLAASFLYLSAPALCAPASTYATPSAISSSSSAATTTTAAATAAAIALPPFTKEWVYAALMRLLHHQHHNVPLPISSILHASSTSTSATASTTVSHTSATTAVVTTKTASKPLYKLRVLSFTDKGGVDVVAGIMPLREGRHTVTAAASATGTTKTTGTTSTTKTTTSRTSTNHELATISLPTVLKLVNPTRNKAVVELVRFKPSTLTTSLIPMTTISSHAKGAFTVHLVSAPKATGAGAASRLMSVFRRGSSDGCLLLDWFLLDCVERYN